MGSLEKIVYFSKIGKTKKPAWIQRESVQINIVGDTLNFLEMADSVGKPALEEFVFTMESEVNLCVIISISQGINFLTFLFLFLFFFFFRGCALLQFE